MKKIVTLFVIFAFLLAIAFLWQECKSFDIGKKINSEKVGNYFTALGAVATAISIYFLYGQLLEMELARRAAYRPDLYPAYSEFKVVDVTKSTVVVGITKTTVQVLPYDHEKPDALLNPLIKIHNIGLGSAKNISIAWNYDLTNISEMIKGVYHSDISKPEKEHIDFLPANGQNFMNIPTHYFSCCGEQLNQSLLDEVLLETRKPKPELKLNLRYQDIQDIWFDKCFSVGVDASGSRVSLKFSAIG